MFFAVRAALHVVDRTSMKQFVALQFVALLAACTGFSMPGIRQRLEKQSETQSTTAAASSSHSGGLRKRIKANAVETNTSSKSSGVETKGRACFALFSVSSNGHKGRSRNPKSRAYLMS